MIPFDFCFSLLAQSGIVPRGTRSEVFNQIYEVFLILGTVVGIVVIAYMLYNAYIYRDHDDREPIPEAKRPSVGELPEGGGGGRKLLLSFVVSTVIVVSLIFWTYGTLLFVESTAAADSEDVMEVEVVGQQFGWQFTYENGTTSDTLRVPANQTVRLRVTSADVFHNFGIPAQRVKTDAIPGQYTNTWFRATETGTYQAKCYELCGAGHSYMTAEVKVMEPEAFDAWYANTTGSNESSDADNASAGSSGGAHDALRPDGLHSSTPSTPGPGPAPPLAQTARFTAVSTP